MAPNVFNNAGSKVQYDLVHMMAFPCPSSKVCGMTER